METLSIGRRSVWPYIQYNTIKKMKLKILFYSKQLHNAPEIRRDPKILPISINL